MARMIRDWTDSERIDKLSPSAEVLFTRLLMKADDYGRYHANTKLLKAALYPLKENILANDLTPLIDEIIDAELAIKYIVDGREYLEIYNFGQRLRVQKSKFPGPQNGECAKFGTQNVTNPPRTADNCPPELEEKRSRIEEEVNIADKPPTDILEKRKNKFYNELIPYVEKYSAEMIRKFYDYWTELNKSGKTMRWESERFFEIPKRIATWHKNDNKFKNNLTINQTKNLDDGQRIRKSEAQ
jgi:hypothetical protein